MSKKPKENDRITIPMDDDILAWVKKEAKKHRCGMSAIVRDALLTRMRRENV